MNDADRLSLDPVMRRIVGGHAVTKQAALSSQMGHFETEALVTEENPAALADLSGRWIDGAVLMKANLQESSLDHVDLW